MKIAAKPDEISGLFFFCFGLFFELLRPGRIFDAADTGDEGDQTAKEEDGRNASEDELIERPPPNDNQPDPNNHSNEAGDNGQILAHVYTSSFLPGGLYQKFFFEAIYFIRE
jgi:hypothetical protein